MLSIIIFYKEFPTTLCSRNRKTKNQFQERKLQTEAEKYGLLAETFIAIQAGIAWNLIYEPKHDRVVSTVGRLWNEEYGGYCLFGWDNFFLGRFVFYFKYYRYQTLEKYQRSNSLNFPDFFLMLRNDAFWCLDVFS